MMADTRFETRREAAYHILERMFPKRMKDFGPEDITPEAAYFAFQLAAEVDDASRVSKGLFNVYKSFLTGGKPSSFKKIPKKLAKEALKLGKDPNRMKMNKIGKTGAVVHGRRLERHLQMPDVHPCPVARETPKLSSLPKQAYRELNEWIDWMTPW